MKNITKFISFILVATFFCFAATTVSAATYHEFNDQWADSQFSLDDSQYTPTSFTVVFPAEGLIAEKLAGKKERPDHPNKKEPRPPSSPNNSSALSSNSQASSESPSSLLMSSSDSSSKVLTAASPRANPSLLIPALICLVIGIAFAAIAILMRKKNKANARLLDETSEIEISDELKQPVDKYNK